MKKEIALAMLIVAGGCRRVDQDDRRAGNLNAGSPVAASARAESVSFADTGDVQAPLCGVSLSTKLTDQGVGDLQIGRPVAEVKRLCNVTSDSHRISPQGQDERVVAIQIAAEIILAVVADDRISRIEVSTSRFTTADSLGVDTPLKKIAHSRGAQFAPGEDGVYGFVAGHCGLSFRFSLPLRPPAGGEWTVKAIDKDHGEAVVDRVLVRKCG